MRIIDAWMQHPSARFLREPMFDSLRRWAHGQLAGDEVPVEATMAAMDAAGVQVGMLCAWWGPHGPIITNDEVAAICRRYPGRFAGVAAAGSRWPRSAPATVRHAGRAPTTLAGPFDGRAAGTQAITGLEQRITEIPGPKATASSAPCCSNHSNRADGKRPHRAAQESQPASRHAHSHCPRERGQRCSSMHLPHRQAARRKTIRLSQSKADIFYEISESSWLTPSTIS